MLVKILLVLAIVLTFVLLFWPDVVWPWIQKRRLLKKMNEDKNFSRQVQELSREKFYKKFEELTLQEISKLVKKLLKKV